MGIYLMAGLPYNRSIIQNPEQQPSIVPRALRLRFQLGLRGGGGRGLGVHGNYSLRFRVEVPRFQGFLNMRPLTDTRTYKITAGTEKNTKHVVYIGPLNARQRD